MIASLSPRPMQLIGPGQPGAGLLQPGDVPRTDRDVGKRIAVVEDELMVAWSLETMLEDLGHEVAGIFAKGEDALAALRDEPVDLVCMDINLGAGIDGIETAQRLRQMQPVSILFISAYSDPAVRSRINEAVPGALLLGKPVVRGDLKLALSEMSGGAH